MNNNTQNSFDWNKEEYDKFGREVQVLNHNYHHSELFSDSTLIDLLDNYPRTWLQCYTMGVDPEKHKEWTPVHIAESSGADIFQALQNGRIWVNAININKYKKEYVELIRHMYQNINSNCSNISNAKSSFSALLLSSPKVQVYYHLDADPNMLWHLQGTKKVWVYPAKDSRFAPQTYIEEIIGEERHENLPYEKWFDEHARSVLLKPGQVVSWPQHGPHRVENVDLNISLATSYQSRESIRLNSVHAANHHFLKKIGIKNRSTQTDGLIPTSKEFSFRLLNKLKLLKSGERTSTYISDLIVDSSSEKGMSKLDTSSRTAFSYID